MDKGIFDLAYLADPTIYAVGRLPAVSDHDCYASAAEADAGASSLTMCLNGMWKFHYADMPDDRPAGFAQPDYDVAAWDEIAVPGHIQLQGYGEPQYVNVQYPWDGREALRSPAIPQLHNPVGSYVRFFDLPERFCGERVILTFHGAETALYCWLNGAFVGYAEDSFTPSRFDVTDKLVPGVNRLAVEVYRFSTASWLEDQDFWRFSGIFRDVELQAQPRAHVRDVFAHTDLADDFASATLRVDAALDLPDEPVTLRASLIYKGEPVASLDAAAAPEQTLSLPIERPRLWSAECPALYTLRLTLLAGGDEVEVAETRVGFRRFEIKGGLMLLNGKRILFHGADRHEFCAKAGRALPYEDMLTDIRMLKRHNINAVRTSHYPNHSAWYRLCDEHGIYLIDECNLETHGTWAYTPDRERDALPGDREEWLPAVLDRARSMQERDKNHPSVLIWSCGNESFGGKDICEMAELMRSRDPDRVIHYEGIFHDPRYPRSTDVTSRMYPPAAEIRDYLREHADMPYLLCEYAHAMGNSCGALHKYVALEDEFPQYQGGFIWDFVDQALWTTAPNGKPRLAYGGDFDDRPNDREFSGDGLLFADRTPSPKLQEVKYLYQDVRITPDASGVTLQNRYLFLNTSAFTLRWALLRDGEAVQRGALDAPDVPAGETRRFELPVAKPTLGGEYVLHCGLCPRERTMWADERYELMHGEAIVAAIPKEGLKPVADYLVVPGDVNIGVRGKGFEAMFSKAEGGLSSLRGANGRELMMTAPAPSLFRATTDNDRANPDMRGEAPWLAASLTAKGRFVSADAEGGLLRVRFEYDLHPVAGAALHVSYTALGGGRLLVELHFTGKQGMPDMAALGLSFRLPASLCDVRYYGLGPEECYCDRMHGARLGRFGYRVADNLTRYLVPQECGNREGVRELRVTGADRHGVRVECAGAPLSISVLPHSAIELMAARHPDELASPSYTYLDVALCRKGVGGDDSWGARVHPEYRLSAECERRGAFVLSVI